MSNYDLPTLIFWNVNQLTTYGTMEFGEAIQKVLNEQLPDHTEDYRADLYAHIMENDEWSVEDVYICMEAANG